METTFFFLDFKFSRFRMRTGLGFSYVQWQKTSETDTRLFSKHPLFNPKAIGECFEVRRRFLDFLRAFFIAPREGREVKFLNRERRRMALESNIDHQLDWTVWLNFPPSSRVATITFFLLRTLNRLVSGATGRAMVRGSLGFSKLPTTAPPLRYRIRRRTSCRH